MEMSVRCYRVAGRGSFRLVLEAERKRHSGLIVQGFRWEGKDNEFLFRMIAEQTLRATETGNLLATKPEIDLILRLAGTTQITEAIARVGVREGEPFVVLVAGKSREVGDPTGRGGWKRLKSAELSTEELAMVEKAALQNARRS